MHCRWFWDHFDNETDSKDHTWEIAGTFCVNCNNCHLLMTVLSVAGTFQMPLISFILYFHMLSSQNHFSVMNYIVNGTFTFYTI